MSNLNNSIQFFVVFTFMFVVWNQDSRASGGWVGNGAIASYRPTTIYTPSYEFDESSESPTWNSLLLPKGAWRFRFGFESYQLRNKRNVGEFSLAFDYAFTEKLTTFNLFGWGYSLLAGNGKGHEMALYFGVYGFGSATDDGAYANPGVGLGYSYSADYWRYTTSIMWINQYSFDHRSVSNSYGKVKMDYSHRVGENWAAGAGLDSYIQSSVSKADEDSMRSYELIAYPKLFVTRNINEKSEITFGVGLSKQQNFTVDYAISW